MPRGAADLGRPAELRRDELALRRVQEGDPAVHRRAERGREPFLVLHDVEARLYALRLRDRTFGRQRRRGRHELARAEAQKTLAYVLRQLLTDGQEVILFSNPPHGGQPIDRDAE